MADQNKTAAGRIRAFLDTWAEAVSFPDYIATTSGDRGDRTKRGQLMAVDVRALLTECEQLAARVAELEAAPQPIAIATDFHAVSDADVRKWREAVNAAAGKPLFVLEPSPDEKQTQAERDADVRAVAALLDAITALGPHPAGLERRAEKLRARFAEPIAALDARTTDGGADPGGAR